MDPARLAELYEEIEPLAAGGLARARPLKKLTSFQIGGPADLLLEPPSVEVLAAALRKAYDLGVPVTLLGGGTNILIADAGIRGLVVRLGKPFERLTWEREEGEEAVLTVGAASRMIRVAKESVSRGWQGLEFAAGIPGTTGGAAQMNAGAFGGEIGNAIEALELVTRRGEILWRPRAELEFSYRKLALDEGVVITSIRFRLRRSSVGRLKEVVASVQAKRRRSQPAGVPNAGSIFKNPPNEYAGRLIERTGLKGTAIGGAQVSVDHANFIVNVKDATAANVRDLMGLIQAEVWRKCGVWLEPEVRLIGDWG